MKLHRFVPKLKPLPREALDRISREERWRLAREDIDRRIARAQAERDGKS